MLPFTLFLYLTSSAFDKYEKRHKYNENCAKESNKFTLQRTRNSKDYYADCKQEFDVTITSNSLDSNKVADYLFAGSNIKKVKFDFTATQEIIIGEGAFSFCKSLESISFPNVEISLTIGTGAFCRCTKLGNIDFQHTSSLIIGESSFEECTSLNIQFVKDNNYKVDSLSVSNYGFYRCKSLTGDFPEATTIEQHAFEDCEFKTKEIKITAEKIETCAFRNCGITSLSLDCPSIGERAFESSQTKTLKKLNKQENFFFGDYAFQGFTIECSFQLSKTPSSSEDEGKISNYAFADCIFVNNVELTSVTIGSYAFYNSIFTTSTGDIVLTIDKSTISSHSFEETTGNFILSLKNFDDSKIDDYAFYKSNVKASGDSLVLKRTTIGTRAFAECSKLIGSLSIIGGQINSYAFERSGFTGSIRIDGIGISESAFENLVSPNGIAELIIGNEKTDIHDVPNTFTSKIDIRAFAGLKIRNRLVVHSSINSIDEYAFESLTFVGNNVNQIKVFSKEINPYAFYKVSGTISQLDIYSETIGFHAFDGCNVVTLTIDRKDKLEATCTIGEQAFYGLKITQLAVSEEYEIGKAAFTNCEFVASGAINPKLVINASTIGSYAFSDCKSETNACTVSIGNSEIENSAFENFGNIQTLTFHGKMVQSDSEKKKICERAFYGSKIVNAKGLVIPSYIKEVGKMAFANITTLFEGSKDAKLSLNCSKLLHSCFIGCTNVMNFELNSELTIIGKYAFYDTGLTGDIIIPKKVTNIRESAFQGLKGLKKITIYSDSQLKEIGLNAFRDSGISGTLQIPKSMETIKAHAFENCKGLTSIILYYDGKLNSIGDYAFYQCSGITRFLDIPKLVTKIGKYAFAQCTKLEGHLSVYLGAEIGVHAFDGCGKFGITIINNQQPPTTNTIIKKEAFKGLDINSDVVIPATVTKIGPSAFEGCANLKSLSFETESSLDRIESKAFYNCVGLSSSLVIPSSVTKICESAFEGCINLRSLVIESSGKTSSSLTIEKNAFANSGISGTLIISSNVKDIGESAFKGCSNLYTLILKAGLTVIESYAFADTGLDCPLTIPSTLTKIGENAFENCKFRTLAFTESDNEIKIGSNAFHNCIFDGDLVITKNVKTISESAFEGCTGLKSLTIEAPTQLNIKSKAFASSTISGSLTIPSGVSSIDESAFKDCKELESLVIESEVNIEKDAFYGCGISTLTITASINTIGESAFENCTNLATLNIDGIEITEISKRAFYSCPISNNLVIPKDCTTIGESAFENTQLASLTLNENPDLTIKDRAFYGSAIAGPLIIYEGQTVGKYAFSKCTNLQGPLEITGATIGDNAFQGCVGLQTMSEVTDCKIGDYVFEGCTSLQGPLTVKGGSIGKSAFQGCTSLQGQLELETSEVGDYAFQGCIQLNGPIIIKSGELNEYVFEGCTLLGSQTTHPEDEDEIDASILILGGKVGLYNFKGCNNITGIVYVKNGGRIDDNAFDSVEGSGFSLIFHPEASGSVGDRAFYNSSITGELTIPKGITSVGIEAFSNCKFGAPLTLCAKQFKEGAFAYSRFGGNLTINIEEDKNKDCGIDETTFLGVSNFTTLVIKKLKSVKDRTFNEMSFFTGLLEIPSGLTYIGHYAFTGCGFSEIRFKDLNSVVTIGKSAFSGLTELNTNILFPPIQEPGATARLTGSKKIQDYMFYKCDKLLSFNIPDETTEIGDYAFYGCKNLAITNMDGFLHIEQIGRCAFEGCVNLKGPIEFSSSLTDIRENAFYGCTGLSGSLLIKAHGNEDEQTYIGASAFKGCTGFNKGTLTIVVENDEETRQNGHYSYSYSLRIGNQAFEDCGFKNIYYNGRFEPDCDYDIGFKHTKGIHTSSNYANKSFCSNPLHHDKLSGGAIAGICIACIVVFAALVVLLVILIIKNKRAKRNKSENEVEMNADP